MKPYYELIGMECLYFEDSYVLGLSEDKNCIIFDMDIVLRECHPLYNNPLNGEQYCHRRANLVFREVPHVKWINRSFQPSTDKDGKIDYGNIDTFEEDGGAYDLTGDWGEVRIISALPEIDFT